MKTNDVPQDSDNSTYGGARKLLYAVDENGEYRGVTSVGWEVESEATMSALAQCRQQSQAAWQRASRAETAPLEYYMHYRRMDLLLLAQATGLWRWRIRRHFKPQVFARLNARLLARYSAALGIDIAELKQLPEQPWHD